MKSIEKGQIWSMKHMDKAHYFAFILKNFLQQHTNEKAYKGDFFLNETVVWMYYYVLLWPLQEGKLFIKLLKTEVHSRTGIVSLVETEWGKC